MKKIFLFTALFLFFGSSVVFAQVDQQELRKADTDKVEKQSMEERTEISQDKLPATALATLKGSQFEGWKVERAYKVKRGDKKVYQVTLTNGVEVVTAWFDENGNLLG